MIIYAVDTEATDTVIEQIERNRVLLTTTPLESSDRHWITEAADRQQFSFGQSLVGELGAALDRLPADLHRLRTGSPLSPGPITAEKRALGDRRARVFDAVADRNGKASFHANIDWIHSTLEAEGISGPRYRLVDTFNPWAGGAPETPHPIAEEEPVWRALLGALARPAKRKAPLVVL